MRRLRIGYLIILLVATASLGSCSEEENCCKTCTVGKACGDSCIAKEKDCDEGVGCACNG